MRGRLMLALTTTLLIPACGQPGSSPEPVPSTEPAADSDADSAQAEAPFAVSHGGVAIRLGDDDAELVVHASGEIHLYLHAAPAPRPEDFGASVTFTDTADRTHTVALRETDAIQGLVGRVRATPAPGEFRVLMVQAGRVTRGMATVEDVLPAPEHGGSVVAVGDHVAEVVVGAGGRTDVYLLDAPDQRLDLELTLSIAGADGHLHPLALVWDDDQHHYVGHIEGLRPQPGPMEVIVEEAGESYLGQGSLLGVQLTNPDPLGGVPDDFQLAIPDLGASRPQAAPVVVEP